MEPAAVEEHAGKERPVVIQREPQLNRPFGMSVTRRDNAEIIEELLQHRLGHGELEEKDHAVNHYYDPGAEGRIFGRNRVANRNNGRLPLFPLVLPQDLDHCLVLVIGVLEWWSNGVMHSDPILPYSNNPILHSLRRRRALSWTAFFVPLGVCPSLHREFQSATRRPVRISHDSLPVADFALK